VCSFMESDFYANILPFENTTPINLINLLCVLRLIGDARTACCSHTEHFQKKWQNVNTYTRTIRVRVKVSDSVYAAIFHTSPVANFRILHSPFYHSGAIAESCYSLLSQICYYYNVAFTKYRFIVDNNNHISFQSALHKSFHKQPKTPIMHHDIQ